MQQLGMALPEGLRCLLKLQAVPLATALERLDRVWDDWFEFSGSGPRAPSTNGAAPAGQQAQRLHSLRPPAQRPLLSRARVLGRRSWMRGSGSCGFPQRRGAASIQRRAAAVSLCPLLSRMHA